VRPRPGIWLRLPHTVVDAATLADHLRAYAATCAGEESDPPRPQILTAAAMLDGVGPEDVAALRRVVEVLDWHACVAPDTPVLSERRTWESVAHAVDRIADHVESTGGWRPVCSTRSR